MSRIIPDITLNIVNLYLLNNASYLTLNKMYRTRNYVRYNIYFLYKLHVFDNIDFYLISLLHRNKVITGTYTTTCIISLYACILNLTQLTKTNDQNRYTKRESDNIIILPRVLL